MKLVSNQLINRITAAALALALTLGAGYSALSPAAQAVALPGRAETKTGETVY